MFVLLVTSPLAEEIAGKESIYVLLMCFQLRGILSHCKGLELLCEMCLFCYELNGSLFKYRYEHWTDIPFPSHYKFV